MEKYPTLKVKLPTEHEEEQEEEQQQLFHLAVDTIQMYDNKTLNLNHLSQDLENGEAYEEIQKTTIKEEDFLLLKETGMKTIEDEIRFIFHGEMKPLGDLPFEDLNSILNSSIWKK